MIKIKKGLDLPISGEPDQQRIQPGPTIRTVAVVGFDYHGMKPTMEVKEGDRVKTGQLLFTCKKTKGIRYTAPASGTVSAVNRGAKRVLQSVVIDVEGDEHIEFERYEAGQLGSLSREQVQANLVESGLWTALRTRPYSKVPALDAQAQAIFVNAMDSHPLAPNPQLFISEAADDFAAGIEVLGALTEGTVHVCTAPGASLPSLKYAQTTEFDGPHPAGLSGTHVHHLAPVSVGRQVWTLDYQDAIAIGRLFTTGRINPERVISLAGPQVEEPRVIRTRLGASTDELTAGQMKSGDNRVLTGSVLGGAIANGPTAFLGRYSRQVTVLLEGKTRDFMRYMSAGPNTHSTLRIYLSQFFGGKKFDYTANTMGSERAMVPVGSYEKVMPLDILPTQLLRALIVGDTQTAQQLGALELDEEDLALCTYVCPGKYEYGPILRDNLTRIEEEG